MDEPIAIKDGPECYLNIENADLMIIWWEQNRPKETEWIKISRLCYDRLTRRLN